jgi:hypothetical protein
MAKLTDQERLDAYESAIHELVNALATIKSEAECANELLDAGLEVDAQVTRILDVASGRLLSVREELNK